MNDGSGGMEEKKVWKLGMKPKSRKFSRCFFPIPRAWRQKQLEGHVISRGCRMGGYPRRGLICFTCCRMGYWTHFEAGFLFGGAVTLIQIRLNGRYMWHLALLEARLLDWGAMAPIVGTRPSSFTSIGEGQCIVRSAGLSGNQVGPFAYKNWSPFLHVA